MLMLRISLRWNDVDDDVDDVNDIEMRWWCYCDDVCYVCT